VAAKKDKNENTELNQEVQNNSDTPEKESNDKKPGFIDKILNIFRLIFLKIKRFFITKNKKLLIAIFVPVILLIVAVPVTLTILNNIKKSDEIQKVEAKNIQVIIPDGAFSHEKSFTISEIPDNSLEYQNLKSFANFYGKIYSILPSDGNEESSFIPIKIRYRIPPDLYYGDNYINFSIAYASDGNPPIISEISGAKIIKDGNDYYIEAETFHLSKIGLVVSTPQEASYGLKTLFEKPANQYPDVIILPGSDINFTGFLSNTSTYDNPYGNNIWSLLFPERTIWKYNYPLTDTKSKIYYDSYMGYRLRTGSASFIEFEGKRFAQELKRLPNREFDIIAQGIGGLIARYAVESDPEITNVKNIVLISTPNKGTNLANPLFLNIFYGKDKTSLAGTFGVSEPSMVSVVYNTSFFLEQINSYYKDLIPNSDFLKQLGSFGMRDDINYIGIAGNDPKITENLNNSEVKRFYPEFVKNLGDGIVSVDSSLDASFTKNFLFEQNFYNIYSEPTVLNTIKKTLNDDVLEIKIEPFKDDNFLERYSENYNPDQDSSYNYYVLPANYTQSSIIKNKEKIGNISEKNININVFNSKIYFESKTGIYNSDFEKILDTLVLGTTVYNGKYYVVSFDGVYAMDSSSNIFVKIQSESINFDQAFFVPGHGLISINHSSDYSSFFLDKSLLSTEDIFEKLEIIDNVAYILFKNKISIIQDNRLLTLISHDDLEKYSNQKMGDFIDFIIYNNDYYILTSDYKLFLFDKNVLISQKIADSDIGKLKLLVSENKIFISGNDTLTYIDAQKRLFEGIYDRFPEDIFDIKIYNKKIYFSVSGEEGCELWAGNID